MSEITPDPIMRIALGFMAAKHLFVASEIGVFEKLAGGPMTLDALAAATGIPRRTLRISADAMVSLGLLQREGEGYRNRPRPPPLFSPARPAPICGRCCASSTNLSYGLWTASRAPCATARAGGISSASPRRSSRFSRPGSRRSRRRRRRRWRRPMISPSSPCARCRRRHGIVSDRDLAAPPRSARHAVRASGGLRRGPRRLAARRKARGSMSSRAISSPTRSPMAMTC